MERTVGSGVNTLDDRMSHILIFTKLSGLGTITGSIHRRSPF